MVMKALICSSGLHRSGALCAHKQRGGRRFPNYMIWGKKKKTKKNRAFDLGFLTNVGRKDSRILGREDGLREG